MALLREVFVLEIRNGPKGRWRLSSVYDPLSSLHNPENVKKLADQRTIIKNPVNGKEYRVIRFMKSK